MTRSIISTHIRSSLVLGLLAVLGVFPVHAADRINHAGRVLGDLKTVAAPTLFNTLEADAVLATMQVFPTDNPWNEDVSRLPRLANSDAMIAQVMADLSSSRRTLRLFNEMNFVLVPDAQPLVPIDFFNYADESDPSPYPIPPNLPVETWPSETGDLTLSQWQQDVNDDGGDRHAIMVLPGVGFIWETWLTRLVAGRWEASNGAKFDLKSNTLRPKGWTSGDAAGLPMFPALVRFDECERGEVEHALRLVVKRTRVGPIYPATHQASVGNLTDPNIPAMGQRFRLKAGFVVPDSWTKQEKAVLKGLKKYGAIVADNGGFFSVSVTPDDRYPSGAFGHMSSISITNFEVVQATGPLEGPRSAGVPRADAGADRSVSVGASVTLEGSSGGTSFTAPPSAVWSLYSGPAAPIFADASRTNSAVTFPVPGSYKLLLTVDDQVHTPAYSTVNFQAVQGLSIFAERKTNQIRLFWLGSSGPFTVERADSPSKTQWGTFTNTPATEVLVPISPGGAFFRVRKG